MIPSWLGRRNRFKRKTGPQRSGPRWPWLRIDWRSHGRKVAILLLVVASLGALSWALNRPVQVISMDGSFQRVSPGQIEQAVAPYLSSGFMSANLDQIEHAVERIPWVDHARVQRRWPMSLHVTVVEQTAAARWGDSGLLNTRGELFDRAAAHVPSELPRLSGPAGTETEVAQEYLSAARLDRFIHTAAPVISHRANDVNYVDMRYSNGFAIGWRSAATPPSTPPKGTEEFNG
jgi:cell division protein FtsQ